MSVEHWAPDVIAEYLRKERLATHPLRDKRPDGSFGPWPVYSGMLDDQPDEAIGIGFTGRPTQGRIQKTGETMYHEDFQVRVRSKSFSVASKKAMEVFRAFETVVRYQLSVEDKFYEVKAIHHRMTPTFIGQDPNKRSNFVLNCTTVFKEVEE